MSASDEAVEAAAKAMFLHRSRSNGPDLGRIWDAEMSEDLKSIFRLEARAVIEAVAPHLRAEVPNPYKSAPIYPLGKIEDKRQ